MARSADRDLPKVVDPALAEELVQETSARDPAATLERSVGDRALWLECDLEEFFRTMVAKARDVGPNDAHELAEPYLAGVLAAFVRPTGHDRELLDQPLTLALHHAMHLGGVERFQRLRAVGDSVLYATGFFAEFLTARGVDLRYVRGLGARAYGLAGACLNDAGDDDLFEHLADCFDDYSELVGAISDSLAATAATHTDAGTLRLYERWMKTRSPAAADALIERGLLPVTGSSRTLH